MWEQNFSQTSVLCCCIKHEIKVANILLTTFINTTRQFFNRQYKNNLPFFRSFTSKTFNVKFQYPHNLENILHTRSSPNRAIMSQRRIYNLLRMKSRRNPSFWNSRSNVSFRLPNRVHDRKSPCQSRNLEIPASWLRRARVLLWPT